MNQFYAVVSNERERARQRERGRQHSENITLYRCSMHFKTEHTNMLTIRKCSPIELPTMFGDIQEKIWTLSCPELKSLLEYRTAHYSCFEEEKIYLGTDSQRMNFRCVTNSRLDFVIISIIIERIDSMFRKSRIYLIIFFFAFWLDREEQISKSRDFEYFFSLSMVEINNKQI